MRKAHPDLPVLVKQLMESGYPRVAIFASDDYIHAILVAESDDALRAALSRPEDWDFFEPKGER
jgi:hypothetical protein